MPNFNAFMHRRNIFRKEPDFKKLACDYQELKPFMTVGSKNKLKFDFKNPDALRALTCALLHRYFQKKIILPPDRMIPAVPQRLNYICWIEDLVQLLGLMQPELNVVGIDIGTGASCIFPILSCHRNPTWQFVGVEADQKSFEIASENVRKNFMESKIRMLKVSNEESLNDILCLSTYPITFTMCNPPFFEEEYGVNLESNSNINSGGRIKSSANTSDRIESVASGGEIAFVGRLLEQSRHLKEEVAIYTSMLGKKQSLTHFKQTLSSLNEDNFSWTWAELCQGKTIRYAIAWTYKPGLILTRAPPLRHGKNKSWKFKLARKMLKRDCQLELMEIGEFLKNLVSRELLIAKARVTRQNAQNFEMLIKTNDRTWTHQRRKRREQHQQLASNNNIGTSSIGNANSGGNLVGYGGVSSVNKHKHQATPSTVSFNSSQLSATSVSDLHKQQQHQNYVPNEAMGNFDLGGSQMIVSDSDSSNTREATPSMQGGSSTELANNLLTTAAKVAAVGKVSNNHLIQSGADQCVEMSTDQDQSLGLQLCSKKRKNPSSCSSSPSRICPSPNDELTDDDNQSTDNTNNDDHNEDSMNESIVEIKRICIKDADDSENMDDIYDYLLCCRISLSRVCHDLYFELKLEHPCVAATDAYDLFQYFRNKLSER